MAEIRKITLEEDGTSYEIGDKVGQRAGLFTVESLYLQTLGDDGGLNVLVVRVYVQEKVSPFVDVPFHAISRIFYS